MVFLLFFSILLQIYAWVSVMFVIFSIFAFCAETHPNFRVPLSSVKNMEMIYRYFHVSSARKVQKQMMLQRAAQANAALDPSTNSTNLTGPPDIQVEHPAIVFIDMICLMFFTLEYLMRVIFTPRKVKFLLSLQNVIDFLAVLPDFVQMIIIRVSPLQSPKASFVDFMFIIRVTRLFRIFRLIRHVPGLWILFYTLKASFNELLLMSVFLVIGMVIFASLMYFAENNEGFSNIPIGFWWSVVTMTTVGYGDMYPKSSFGYIIGSLCAISGLLMIAFTVPIIVSNFVLYYTHVQYGLAKKDKKTKSKIYMSDTDLPCSRTEEQVVHNQEPI